MDKYIEINTEQYNQIKRNPVLFFKYNDKVSFDGYGNSIDESTWDSVDKKLGISLDSEVIKMSLSYSLVIIDVCQYSLNKQSNENKIKIHAVTSSDSNDCYFILYSLFLRSQDKEDNYSYMELLWFLNYLKINQKSMVEAIKRLPKEAIPLVISKINLIGRCLSLSKQNELFQLCSTLGFRYSIYKPHALLDAFHLLFPLENNEENLNIFELTDKVIGGSPNIQESGKNLSLSNPFLALSLWMHSDMKLASYSELAFLYAIVSENMRLDMIKRYFHDIRIQNTLFDINLFLKFRDNKYIDFIRYRICLESPAEPIILTVPLLCDTIISLYNSKGESFQTFDGILDFAMTHCDRVHPGIDFQLDRILPVCQNGAIVNPDFKGFIDYSLVRTLDSELLQEEYVRNVIVGILNRYGKKAVYPICKLEGNRALPPDIFKHCYEFQKNINGKIIRLDCFKLKECENKWTVHKSDINVLNTFLSTPLTESQFVKDEALISIDMISCQVLKKYVLLIKEKFEQISENSFLVPSYNTSNLTYDLYLIGKFSKIERMRVFPQPNVLVGPKFDLFGIRKKKLEGIPQNKLSDKGFLESKKQEYLKEETFEVRKRIVESLRKELKSELNDNGYFEVDYDRNILLNLIHKFYYKESFSHNDDFSKHIFLKELKLTKSIKPFCAPSKSPQPNPSLNIDYFWCRGKECFHNNLGNQTLAECNDWKRYSLYHMVEILGYPKLNSTEAGYEPEPMVCQFIAVINKVKQKFVRLICRSCGHMMFSRKSTGFNRHNYYNCVNPTCSQVNIPVYLNFCYSCKKGLIDSRDSHQCPNGWFICPVCLSCCNDEQFERLAQKYTLTQKSIPQWILTHLGKGHNDKKQYYCPNCGGPIEEVKDEHGNLHTRCKKCKREYFI